MADYRAGLLVNVGKGTPGAWLSVSGKTPARKPVEIQRMGSRAHFLFPACVSSPRPESSGVERQWRV
jgi:hypothetical protein